MPLDLWFAFVAASAVLLIIPGPTILTVISYSIAHGRRANVPLVAAVALGDSTALVLSLLGLGALLATSALWFTVVKLTGGLGSGHHIRVHGDAQRRAVRRVCRFRRKGAGLAQGAAALQPRRGLAAHGSGSVGTAGKTLRVKTGCPVA